MKQGVFMRAMQSDATEAIIDVIGVIGWEVGYQQMKDILKTIPDTVQTVNFDIFSPGGDVWEGNGIVQAIGELNQKKLTRARVQVAASMATLIAAACQERTIARNGRFLIHNAWTRTEGDAAQHEKMAKELHDCEKEAAEFYSLRSNGKTSPEQFLKLMAEERWMMPDEALAMGLVDSICDPFKPEDYEEVKKAIVEAGKWPKALVELPKDEPKAEEKKDVPIANNGAAVAPAVMPTEPAQPEAAKEPSADYQLGKLEGRAEGEADRGALLAEIGSLREQVKTRDALISKHQSAADAAKAETAKVRSEGCAAIESLKDQHLNMVRNLESEHAKMVTKLTVAMKEANDRANKMLAGGLTFTPELSLSTTWEDIMARPDFVYENAARAYPELLREFNKRKARK